MRLIAIIPARGGSKRLPRKNILPLSGKPLIAHVIATAIESNIFDKVIVSTEDREIADIARKYGAEIFQRDTTLAQDSSTVVEACLDVLKIESGDLFCCLYATAALLSVKTIQDSYQRFITEKTSVLMGVSEYNYSPIQALKIDDKGGATLLLKEFEKKQSQHYPKIRVSNGTFYWGRREDFIKEKTFYSSNLKVFDVLKNEVCDIDTIDDYNQLVRIFNENSLSG
jgi:pseudaminic acid cytidylyltransferase